MRRHKPIFRKLKTLVHKSNKGKISVLVGSASFGDRLCSTNTSITKPCRVQNVSAMRVRHTCHVYFKEFVTYLGVVSILMLQCPSDIGDRNCSTPTYIIHIFLVIFTLVTGPSYTSFHHMYF